MSGRVLIILPRAEGAPAAWLRIVEESGAIAARGYLHEEEAGEPPLIAQDDTIIAVVPGEAVRMLWLPLDGTTSAQLAAAARYTVAEHTALAPASIHTAIDTTDELPGKTGVAVTDFAAMQTWLSRLAALGIDPDIIIPDHMLLPVPERDAVGFPVGRALLAVRAQGAAMVCEAGLAEAVLGTRALHTEEKASALEAAMVVESGRPRINLRNGAFAQASGWHLSKAWRRCLILAAGVPLLLLLSNLIDIWRTDHVADAIEAESRAVAAAALPPGTPPAEAVQTLLSGSALAEPSDLSAAMQILVAATRGAPGATIESVAWDGTRLAAEMELTAGMTADALRPVVEAAGYDFVAGAPRPQGAGLAVSVELTRP
jgi:type II secretion system protein L|tara:strand:- start:987 stop:2102 length:1116 start_codon:yes stop_codon:yes gene_type:complete